MGMCSHMLWGDCPDSRLSSLLVLLRPGRGLGPKFTLEFEFKFSSNMVASCSTAGAWLAPLLALSLLAALEAGLPFMAFRA